MILFGKARFIYYICILQINQENMQENKIYYSKWPHCSGIYCITNIKNNKKYIGSAINLFKRFRRHNREFKYGYHWNIHMLNSYKNMGRMCLL